MQVSQEEALGILTKWKDESAPLFIFGLKPWRWGLRAVDEGFIDWNIALRGKISDVSVFEGTSTSKAGTVVVFEAQGGMSGTSLLVDTGIFAYDETCEAPRFLPVKAASCISILFASNELFVIYALQEG